MITTAVSQAEFLREFLIDIALIILGQVIGMFYCYYYLKRKYKFTKIKK